MLNRLPSLLAGCAFMLIALVAAATLHAQPFFPNPPCTVVRIVNNNLNCTAQLNFVTIPAGLWGPFALPPGAGVALPNPAPGTTVTGMIDVFGTFHAFNPPAAASGCGPTGYWITGIFLSPVLACSFNVCADPTTCSITLF